MKRLNDVIFVIVVTVTGSMVAVLIGVNPNLRNQPKIHVIRNKIKIFLFISLEEIPSKQVTLSSKIIITLYFLRKCQLFAKA